MQMQTRTRPVRAPTRPATTPAVAPTPFRTAPAFQTATAFQSSTAFQTAPAFRAISAFQAGGGGGGGGGKPPFKTYGSDPGSSPFHEGDGSPFRPRGRTTRKTRRIILLPSLGPARNVSKGRWILPYEEVEYVYEMSSGDCTYSPGMGEDFDELAAKAAAMVCDCDVSPPWCIEDEDDGRELHPLGAVWSDPGECPLELVDVGQWYVDEPEAAVAWKILGPAIKQARSRVLENPRMMFGNAVQTGSIAINVLINAGMDFPEGFYNGEQLAEFVLANLDNDAALRASFADLSVLSYSRRIPELASLAALLEKAGNDDLNFRHPDCLQFLCFDEKQLDGDRDQALPLAGSFECVDVVYKSIFEDPYDKDGWSWMTGWRECRMERTR